MFKNFKLYEADGANNAGGDKTIEPDESKTSNDEIVAPEDRTADQIEANLEASRKAILEDEEGDGLLEINKDDKPELDKDGEIKSDITKTDDEGDKTPTEPTANDAGLVEVTEDYIAKEAEQNFPGIDKEYLAEILNGIKGDQMSPRAFKNYVHSQNKIRHPESTQKPVETDGDGKPKPTNGIDLPDIDKADLTITPEQQEEVNEARVDLILEDLKGKYPELTKEILADREMLNEFVADLKITKPLDADDFRDDFKAAQTQVTAEIKDYVYKAKNWNTIARVEMKKQTDEFVSFLAGNGVKPEDIGVDISEKWIVNNLMKLENGKLNPKVMAHYKGDERIPVVLPNSILTLLKDRFLPEMLKIAKSDGIKHRTTTEPNPSLSSSSIKGKKGEIGDAITSKTQIKPGETDPKVIDKILEAQKKAIFESSEG